MTTIFAETDVADDVQSLDVPPGATAADVATLAGSAGLTREGDTPSVYLEDEEEPLAADAVLPSTDGPCRVHIGPRARIDLSINYNGRRVGRSFSPATTVRAVRRWAAGELKLSETEAERHVLQFCDTTVQPKERRHIGALDRNRDRRLCFDLVPKRRTQGAGGPGPR